MKNKLRRYYIYAFLVMAVITCLSFFYSRANCNVGLGCVGWVIYIIPFGLLLSVVSLLLINFLCWKIEKRYDLGVVQEVISRNLII